MPFAFKSFPEYIKSLKNRENLILIRISGGAYGDYWSRDFLCPKTIDLKKLEEKLRNEAWGYITPEETFEFLNKILSVMAKSIFKFGGTLDKFIGDEIMAIFGAPVEDKEHAKKAVFASIEMMKNMKNVSKFVKIGIGINTGKMMVGNIGTEERMEYTAIGDAVNLASRIEKIAGPEEILITETTYHQVKDVVKCEFLGEREIRGKEKRVRIYRVIWEEQK